ncbi:MAG: ATP-binding protein [Candidatus Omnitrophota bacterium]
MKISKFSTIRGRLTFWYAVMLAIIFLISYFILYQVFKGNLMTTVDSTLITAAEQAEKAMLTVRSEKWREKIKRVEREFLVNRLFIQVLEMPQKEDGDFGLIARAGVLPGNISQKEIWDKIAHRFPEHPVLIYANEQTHAENPLRIMLYPVKKVTSGRYLIEVGSSLKKVSETLNDFLIILIVSGPVMALVLTFGGFMVLTKALQPVKLVARTARRITTEDLSLRIPAQERKDEIGHLITTFNDMILRLEQSVTRIKQFSSDASHDLKTPLTVIRGEIEITLRKERTIQEYQKTLHSLHEESRKLETIIDNLLFLSRVDAVDYTASLHPIPLDEVLLNVFEKMERLASQKHIAYILKGIESVFIDGDDILLNRLFTNIIDNAIKYTPDGGKIEIELVKTAEHLRFSVQDTGIGIPKHSLPFIFDRFYRVDQSRSQESGGSGLGLSIVKKITDIHRATVDVESEPNKGTTFHIYFPFKIKNF